MFGYPVDDAFPPHLLLNLLLPPPPSLYHHQTPPSTSIEYLPCKSIAMDPDDPPPDHLPLDHPPGATLTDTLETTSSSSPPLKRMILLRPAIFRTEPLLLCQIHQTVADCNGLTNTERAVLLGVLVNMPSKFRVENSPVGRLLSLSATELRLLASLFEQGLIAARKFGGRPVTGSNSVDNTNKRSSDNDDLGLPAKRLKLEGPVEGNHTVFEVPQMSPTMPPPLTPIMSLLHSLGISHALPQNVESRRLTRRGSLDSDCLSRQQNTCPITGRTSDTYHLETAHLVPHALAAIESIAVTPYWTFLSVCLGPPLTSHIYAIGGGSKSFLSTNGLSLDSAVHHLFDRGTVCLIPHVADDAFDPKTTRYYDVEFVWRGTMAGLIGMTTQLPLLPDEQVDDALANYTLMGAVRPISIGDRFRLFTRDPARFPLPHPLLLSLHCMLWDMIAGAVLGETSKAKQVRVPPPDNDARGRRKRIAQHSRGRSGPASATSGSTGATVSTPVVGEHQLIQHGGAVSSYTSVESGGGGTAVFLSEEAEYLDFKLRQLAASEVCSLCDGDEEEEEEWEGELMEGQELSQELVWEFNEFQRKRDAVERGLRTRCI